MFKDYYTILGIKGPTSKKEVKAAFKKQALKHHPDRNSNSDSTIRMQEINEAYSILNNDKTKHLYDIEYLNYKKTVFAQKNKSSSTSHNYSDYSVKDDYLKAQMEEARVKAVQKKEKSGKAIISILGSIGSIALVTYGVNSPVFILGSILFPIMAIVWSVKYFNHK
jgi:DnaJ-class molecular chaperone